ncbi:hypothetical protein CDAR_398491 [Caerostris darwini]|uniref:Uncharacterized protein n=1 Tax=Caerostris darwini TaxID=1538125 RepID=A0AAV4VF29_9ARAC|nr:hypothetical protein CDAR_398491 [Caerostris darwini]
MTRVHLPLEGPFVGEMEISPAGARTQQLTRCVTESSIPSASQIPYQITGCRSRGNANPGGTVPDSPLIRFDGNRKLWNRRGRPRNLRVSRWGVHVPPFRGYGSSSMWCHKGQPEPSPKE